MKQILNRRLLAFLLCAALLVTICGCQKKTKQLDSPPLDKESVAYLESLFGITPQELLEELGLSEKDVTEKLPGLVWINQPIVVEGKEFTKVLAFSSGEPELAKFNSFQYRRDCENAEETAEVAEAVYLAAVEEYGKAKHGHLTGPSFLDNEGVFDEIRKAKGGGWNIAWVVGEFSYLLMEVMVDEDEEWFTVELKYSVLPEEWHRFDPEYKSSVSLGPTLRSDGLD